MITLSHSPKTRSSRFLWLLEGIGGPCALFQGSPLLPKDEKLTAYVERLKARPAYQRGAAKDGG